MTKQQRKDQFYLQVKLSKNAFKNNNLNATFYHLESAHILGQKHVSRHTLSHFYMLSFGVKTNNYRESVGQIFRIFASLVFTLIWVPKGNTGGVNISPLKPIPIRKELLKYFLK